MSAQRPPRQGGVPRRPFAAGESLAQLLEAALARLRERRLTFSEDDALADTWKAGYEIYAADNPRFVLAREADGGHRRQWRLTDHTLANNRLLDALISGGWDGRELEAELARLDGLDGVRYIFCPLDQRFVARRDGTWEPLEREVAVPLPADTRATLDALADTLLERWRAAGSAPWTVRWVVDALAASGWAAANAPGAWQLVRAWLHDWPAAVRVGPDYWTLADAVPSLPNRSRLQVPRLATAAERPASLLPEPPMADSLGAGDTDAPPIPAPEADLPAGTFQESELARWTAVLRTVNLLEGFIHVPSSARAAYPPRAPEQGHGQLVRGKWFDTDEDLWVWLDRRQDLLFGPDLAARLAWLDAGQRVAIQWHPDVIVFRTGAVDEAVQREETRLVDIADLAALRGGLGENYRQSLVAILRAHPEGLPFAAVVVAVRERQGHVVHGGTVRAVLHAADFPYHDGRWHAPADEVRSRRQFSTALLQSLMPAPDGASREAPHGGADNLRSIAEMVRRRLAELLRENTTEP